MRIAVIRDLPEAQCIGWLDVRASENEGWRIE